MQRAGVCGAAAVGEGVKLLDIAKRMVRLGLDPGPQPDFEGAVRERCANSNGPLGSALALAIVMVLGWPSVTATSTATRSAEIASPELDALVFRGGLATSIDRCS